MILLHFMLFLYVCKTTDTATALDQSLVCIDQHPVSLGPRGCSPSGTKYLFMWGTLFLGYINYPLIHMLKLNLTTNLMTIVLLFGVRTNLTLVAFWTNAFIKSLPSWMTLHHFLLIKPLIGKKLYRGTEARAYYGTKTAIPPKAQDQGSSQLPSYPSLLKELFVCRKRHLSVCGLGATSSCLVVFLALVWDHRLREVNCLSIELHNGITSLLLTAG